MPRALNLDTLRDSTARLSEAVRSALGWWLGELGALIPSAVKTALGGRAAPIFVTVDTTTIAVADAAGVALGQFVAHPAGSLPAALAHRVAEAGSVILLLPDSDVLRRVIDLPLTAERELRAAMFFEIDRQTPFASDQTYHRYRVEKRDLARKRLRVALAVTPRATADAALNALDANGVSVGAASGAGCGWTSPGGRSPPRPRCCSCWAPPASPGIAATRRKRWAKRLPTTARSGAATRPCATISSRPRPQPAGPS